MLRAVLHHDVGQLVVHVLFDTSGSFFLLRRVFTDDLCLDRASGWECLGNTFRLKPHNGLSQHRVEHTTRTVPRLRTFFIPQTQEFQTLNVGRHPLFPVHDVFVEVLDQLVAQRVK